MIVMVEDAPLRALPPLPSPPVKHTSRSTTDQFRDHSFMVYGVQAKNSAPARVLCGSVAHDLPSDTYFAEIVGFNTALLSQGYHSTVSVDRRAISALRGKAFLTPLDKHMDVATYELDTMTASPALHFAGSRVDPALKQSLGRLNYLRSLPDSWLGEESCGASKDAGIQAEKLLRRIRKEVPSAPLPVLGLDTDGTIVMSWSRDDLVGSMTIYGDGTFSYFVRRKGAPVKNIDAKIDQPLGKDLTDILAA